MGAGIFNIDVGSIVDGASKLVDSIGNQIRGKVPVDVMEMAKLEVQMESMKNVIPTLLAKVDEGQAAINAEDAKSKSFFQSGWRPFCGWLCVSAMALTYIFIPLATFFIGLFTDTIPAMPKLDSGELMTLLFGLLGLGTLRTYEKMKK
jgi:hypothetical protein